jgi:hypothetical protein
VTNTGPAEFVVPCPYPSRITGNWIIGTNLRPLAEMLSWEVKYDFNRADWDAIATALDGTDEAQGRWDQYTLAGEEGEVVLRFAWTDRENEGTLVSVEIDGTPEVEAAADVATSLMQSFYLHPDHPQ